MNYVISEKIARKLARIGWKQGQTKCSYRKRPHCAIYDLVEKKGLAGWGWDAPDQLELKKMFKIIGIESKAKYDYALINRDNIALELIEYCKKNKINLSNYIIGTELEGDE
jgi:hypothetical protein